tara:strand:+ start:568 stop:1275 length:708 start_codon:yes stop_codon:yes gene_type:complete
VTIKRSVSFAKAVSVNTINKIKAIVSFSKISANITFSTISKTVTIAKIEALAVVGEFLKFLNLSENASIADSEIIDYQKNISENPVLADQSVLSTAKSLTDSSSISDSQVFSTSTVHADSGIVSDSLANNLSKSIVDISTVNDVFLKNITFNRAFTDNAFATDDVDGAASAEDDQEIQFFKVIANIGLATEQDVKLFEKQISDIINVSDAGVFRGQGYCDFEYFADDYVGFSGNF